MYDNYDIIQSTRTKKAMEKMFEQTENDSSMMGNSASGKTAGDGWWIKIMANKHITARFFRGRFKCHEEKRNVVNVCVLVGN